MLGATFTQQAEGLRADKFMDTMSDSARRFLGTQDRDFMYVTLDESRYH